MEELPFEIRKPDVFEYIAILVVSIVCELAVLYVFENFWLALAVAIFIFLGHFLLSFDERRVCKKCGNTGVHKDGHVFRGLLFWRCRECGILDPVKGQRFYKALVQMTRKTHR